MLLTGLATTSTAQAATLKQMPLPVSMQIQPADKVQTHVVPGDRGTTQPSGAMLGMPPPVSWQARVVHSSLPSHTRANHLNSVATKRNSITCSNNAGCGYIVKKGDTGTHVSQGPIVPVTLAPSRSLHFSNPRTQTDWLQ